MHPAQGPFFAAWPSRGTSGTENLAAARAARAGDDTLRGMCAEFEALLIRQILEAAGGPGLDGSDDPSAAVVDVRTEVARALAERGCLGIGDILYAQLKAEGE